MSVCGSEVEWSVVPSGQPSSCHESACSTPRGTVAADVTLINSSISKAAGVVRGLAQAIVEGDKERKAEFSVMKPKVLKSVRLVLLFPRPSYARESDKRALLLLQQQALQALEWTVSNEPWVPTPKLKDEVDEYYTQAASGMKPCVKSWACTALVLLADQDKTRKLVLENDDVASALSGLMRGALQQPEVHAQLLGYCLGVVRDVAPEHCQAYVDALAEPLVQLLLCGETVPGAGRLLLLLLEKQPDMAAASMLRPQDGLAVLVRALDGALTAARTAEDDQSERGSENATPSKAHAQQLLESNGYDTVRQLSYAGPAFGITAASLLKLVYLLLDTAAGKQAVLDASVTARCDLLSTLLGFLSLDTDWGKAQALTSLASLLCISGQCLTSEQLSTVAVHWRDGPAAAAQIMWLTRQHPEAWSDACNAPLTALLGLLLAPADAGTGLTTRRYVHTLESLQHLVQLRPLGAHASAQLLRGLEEGWSCIPEELHVSMIELWALLSRDPLTARALLTGAGDAVEGSEPRPLPACVRAALQALHQLPADAHLSAHTALLLNMVRAQAAERDRDPEHQPVNGTLQHALAHVKDVLCHHLLHASAPEPCENASSPPEPCMDASAPPTLQLLLCADQRLDCMLLEGMQALLVCAQMLTATVGPAASSSPQEPSFSLQAAPAAPAAPTAAAAEAALLMAPTWTELDVLKAKLGLLQHLTDLHPAALSAGSTASAVFHKLSSLLLHPHLLAADQAPPSSAYSLLLDADVEGMRRQVLQLLRPAAGPWDPTHVLRRALEAADACRAGQVSEAAGSGQGRSQELSNCLALVKLHVDAIAPAADLPIGSSEQAVSSKIQRARWQLVEREGLAAWARQLMMRLECWREGGPLAKQLLQEAAVIRALVILHCSLPPELPSLPNLPQLSTLERHNWLMQQIREAEEQHDVHRLRDLAILLVEDDALHGVLTAGAEDTHGGGGSGAQLLEHHVFLRVRGSASDQQGVEVQQLLEGCGGIRGLVALMWRGSSGAQEQAAWAVRNLAGGSTELTGKIVEAGAVPPLVALLISGSAGAQEHAAWALKNLTGGSNELDDKIVEAGAVPPLVALLMSSSAEAQEQAAGALSNLACGSDELMDKIMEAGAVPPLVALLVNSSVGAQEQAAGALRNLACVSPELKDKIAEAGAVPPLVALLVSSSVGAQEQAAAVLRELACGSNELEDRIVEAGAVPPLVALLASSSVGAQEQAAAVLRELAYGSNELEDRIVEAGAVPPLVALLASSSVWAQEQAAAALRNLAWSRNDLREKIAGAGALPPLVGLLTSSSAEVKQQAAEAVSRLACGSNECKDKIAEAGAVLALVALLISGSAKVQEQAAGALLSLASGSNAIKNKIVEAGAVPPLVALLSNSSVGAQPEEQAAGALWNLACGSLYELKYKIVEAGALPPLVAMMGRGSAGAQRRAAGALSRLARCDELKDKIVEAGAVDPLVALLVSSPVGAQEQAAEALCTLACGGNELKDKIVEAGAVPRLVALLSSSSNSVGAARAAETLRELARGSSERKDKIVKAGGVPSLVAL